MAHQDILTSSQSAKYSRSYLAIQESSSPLPAVCVFRRAWSLFRTFPIPVILRRLILRRPEPSCLLCRNVTGIDVPSSQRLFHIACFLMCLSGHTKRQRPKMLGVVLLLWTDAGTVWTQVLMLHPSRQTPRHSARRPGTGHDQCYDGCCLAQWCPDWVRPGCVSGKATA